MNQPRPANTINRSAISPAVSMRRFP
jgi:hypothetical protein